MTDTMYHQFPRDILVELIESIESDFKWKYMDMEEKFRIHEQCAKETFDKEDIYQTWYSCYSCNKWAVRLYDKHVAGRVQFNKIYVSDYPQWVQCDFDDFITRHFDVCIFYCDGCKNQTCKGCSSVWAEVVGDDGKRHRTIRCIRCKQ